MKVLIADDHNGFRADLRTYLEKQEGFEVVGEARTGFEAISLSSILHPDVILLDISMPGMSGFEAARQIKDFSPATKIVFITIHEEAAYQAMAEVLEVNGFVCKSSLKHDLPKVLSRLQQSR